MRLQEARQPQCMQTAPSPVSQWSYDPIALVPSECTSLEPNSPCRVRMAPGTLPQGPDVGQGAEGCPRAPGICNFCICNGKLVQELPAARSRSCCCLCWVPSVAFVVRGAQRKLCREETFMCRNAGVQALPMSSPGSGKQGFAPARAVLSFGCWYPQHCHNCMCSSTDDPQEPPAHLPSHALALSMNSSPIHQQVIYSKASQTTLPGTAHGLNHMRKHFLGCKARPAAPTPPKDRGKPHNSALGRIRVQHRLWL